jgi:hypothetical protein
VVSESQKRGHVDKIFISTSQLPFDVFLIACRQKMIARIPLLLCLLASSSAAFAVQSQAHTFSSMRTVLSMNGGFTATTASAALPPPELKVSRYSF